MVDPLLIRKGDPPPTSADGAKGVIPWKAPEPEWIDVKEAFAAASKGECPP